jgi:hypothetical protein
VIHGGCGHAIIEIEVVERIVSLAFRDVHSTSLGKGPHHDSQDVANVAAGQRFIPFADRVGSEAFIAIARHCVVDCRQELHLVQFAFCKAVIQIDMIGIIDLDRINVGSVTISLVDISVRWLQYLVNKMEFMVLNSSQSFLEISCRDLTLLSLLTLFSIKSSKDLITNPTFGIAFIWLDALHAVRHSHSLSDPVLC